MHLGKIALAALLLSQTGAAASVSIEYGDSAFKVKGWKPSPEPAAGWVSVFAVTTAADAPPMFGAYSIENGELTFRPRYALSAGVTYFANFHSGETSVQARIDGPPKPSAPAARVAAIYPSSSVLPSNELKLYLLFSAPMQGGDIFSKIHLVDSSGNAAYLPFVSQELWNRDYTRLTLIFDPGRIKRGVKPNVDMGPVLVEGKRYTLILDRDLKDANGNPLAETFRHDFAAGPTERRGLDPRQWKLSDLQAGTIEPLAVTFDRPLDYALLSDSLQVQGSGQLQGVSGKATVGPGETRWSFQPDQPWKPGDYSLVISTALEDLAGNRIGRPFDVDEFLSPTPRISSESTAIPFRVHQPSLN